MEEGRNTSAGNRGWNFSRNNTGGVGEKLFVLYNGFGVRISTPRRRFGTSWTSVPQANVSETLLGGYKVSGQAIGTFLLENSRRFVWGAAG